MIISFLTTKWTCLTEEQLAFLRPRSDLRFRGGASIGWGRRFSILLIEGRYYGINSAYGYHHLDRLIDWLSRQDCTATDRSVYLNQGMKELGI